MSLKVAVLMGGPSAEAEVSRVSAAGVAEALAARGHEVARIELDTGAAEKLREFGPAVVFPALHGPPGEDGTVQGFLEILGYAYVGSGVHGSAVAMDKGLAKAIFKDHGLPVSEHLVFDRDAEPEGAANAVRTAFGPSVVVKPLGQGSAIGVTPLANGGDVTAALARAFEYGGGALVEPYILGSEITVGVLDLAGQPARALPVIEIRTAAGEWYDYANRYTAGASEHIIPAPVGGALTARLQEIAVAAHRVLGLDDLSRADFIVTDAGKIFLLEVNTLPGMTPTSLYPDGARALGIEFPELVDLLVRSALDRARTVRADQKS